MIYDLYTYFCFSGSLIILILLFLFFFFFRILAPKNKLGGLFQKSLFMLLNDPFKKASEPAASQPSLKKELFARRKKENKPKKAKLRRDKRKCSWLNSLVNKAILSFSSILNPTSFVQVRFKQHLQYCISIFYISKLLFQTFMFSSLVKLRFWPKRWPKFGREPHKDITHVLLTEQIAE